MSRTRDQVLQTLEENCEVIRRLGVRRLGLFGSTVRGDSAPASDLDFLVEFERKSFDRPPIKQRREEAKLKRPVAGYKARRGVVERTHSWLNRYRKVSVSFEKTQESYVGLLTLAAAMIGWRQTIIIYG